MRRKIGTAAILTAFTVAVAVPAFAANGNGSCESGEGCFYNDPNYSGIEIDSTNGSSNWPFSGIENDDDSVKNRKSSSYVVVYNGNNYLGGAMYCANAGEWEDDIAGDRDNSGDSHQFTATATCPAGIQHP
jgi:hypothetical protein